MTRNPVEVAVEAVSRMLVAAIPLEVTMQQIAQRARTVAVVADAAGVTVVDDMGRATTLVATDGLASAVGTSQFDVAGGPCSDVLAEGRIVRIDDVGAAADRWPSFSRDASSQGVASALALPIHTGGSPFGVVSFYSRRPAAFDDVVVAAVDPFVARASVVLANAIAYWNAFNLANGLRTAMGSRAQIEQAKGVIMGTTGRTADEAFTALRQQSQAENRALRDLANEIATRNEQRGE